MTGLPGRLLYRYGRAPYHKGKRHLLTWFHRLFGPVLVKSDYGPVLACFLTNAEQSLIYENPYNTPIHRIIVERLDEFDLFVDIGAHIGLFSLVCALESGGRIRSIAFEPSPREYRRLLTNIAANGVSSISPIHCALGDGPRFAGFQIAEDHQNTGTNHVVAAQSDGNLDVLLLELDMLAGLGAERAFVKIDTEGYEFSVLRGGTGFLGGLASGFGLLEYHPQSAARLGYGLDDIVDLLRDAGFGLSRRIPSPNGFQEDILFVKPARAAAPP